MKAEHVEAGADGLICLRLYGRTGTSLNSELRGMFFGFSSITAGLCDPRRHGHLLQLKQRHGRPSGIWRSQDIRVSGSFTKSSSGSKSCPMSSMNRLPCRTTVKAPRCRGLRLHFKREVKEHCRYGQFGPRQKVYTPIEENAAVYRKLYDILFASIKITR